MWERHLHTTHSFQRAGGERERAKKASQASRNDGPWVSLTLGIHLQYQDLSFQLLIQRIASGGFKVGCGQVRQRRLLLLGIAVGETVKLLYPPLPLLDFPIGTEMGCQQNDVSPTATWATVAS